MASRFKTLTRKVPLVPALAVASMLAVGVDSVESAQANGLTFDDAGITFPDGTTQTTAAGGSPDATYVSCYVALNDYSHDLLSPNETRALSCMYLVGVTGFNAAWLDVPPNSVFFVTDVLVGNPHGSTETGKTNVRLRILNEDCDTGTGIAFGLSGSTFYFRTTQHLETKLFSGSVPLFAVPSGKCLSAFAYSTNSTEVDLRVNGYLTDDIEYFHPARR